MNLSSQQVRDTQGKYLAARARTGTELDWTGLLEEFCHRVLTAERQGDPAVSLRDVQLPSTADEMVVDIDGLAVLLRHPAIIYGDGGVLKSMLVLYILGRLAQRGIRVLFCDWELDAADHRSRLEQLFGDAMPDVAYLRCDRPLVQMVDQVRRTVRDQGMQFVAFDSIGMACDGPPESAETAMRYMQSVRRLGEIGSLHVGHVSKGEDAHRKPFGSVYWHNTARATWNAKLAEGGFDEGRVTIGLYNKKANLGPRQQAVGFEFAFGADGTQVRRVDLAEVDDLAAELPLHQRLRTYLKHGARTRDQISAHFEDVKSSTLRSALHRGTKRGQLVQFPAPDGDKIGLSKEPQS